MIQLEQEQPKEASEKAEDDRQIVDTSIMIEKEDEAVKNSELENEEINS